MRGRGRGGCRDDATMGFIELVFFVWVGRGIKDSAHLMIDCGMGGEQGRK